MSGFIEPQHPKTSMMPDPYAIRRVLNRGWIGQPKINGARSQIHISPDGDVLNYTRQGTLHTVRLPDFIKDQLSRAFALNNGWTVIDCEWERYKDRLHLFDLLQVDGIRCNRDTYRERYKNLKLLFETKIASLNIFLLPVFETREQCLECYYSEDPAIEGLVFKSMNTKGWPNTAIVRCRNKRANFS